MSVWVKKREERKREQNNTHSYTHSLQHCPECGSIRTQLNGHRYLGDGTDIQRFICKACNFRFSAIRARFVAIGSALDIAFQKGMGP
jgi:transposase-like protein